MVWDGIGTSSFTSNTFISKEECEFLWMKLEESCDRRGPPTDDQERACEMEDLMTTPVEFPPMKCIYRYNAFKIDNKY